MAQLSGGLGSLSFDYDLEGDAFSFDGSVIALGTYWESGHAHAFYGAETRVDAASDSVTTTALGADLQVWKVYTLARFGEDGPLISIAAPTRGHIAYRYVLDGPQDEVDDEGNQTLHLGLATVEAGGQAAVDVFLDEDTLARSATASVAVVFGAGVQTRLDDALSTRLDADGEEVDANGVYGARSRALSLDLSLNEILGETLGLRIGYSVRSLWTGRRAFEAPLDVTGAVRSNEAYVPLETFHLVRLGLTF